MTRQSHIPRDPLLGKSDKVVGMVDGRDIDYRAPRTRARPGSFDVGTLQLESFQERLGQHRFAP